MLPTRIFSFDGANRRRRYKHRSDFELRNNTPECTGIRSAYRLAFIQHSRVAVRQWSIQNVRVTNSPAQIGRRPEHFAWLRVVDVWQTPFECDEMATVVAHHAFRHASRP